MAIEKQLKICIGTDRVGFLRARLSLMLVDTDSGTVLTEHFHSVNIAPGDDLSVVRALVERDLAAGWIKKQVWPAITDLQWADVEAHAAIVHKPEVIEAFKAQQRARELEAASVTDI